MTPRPDQTLEDLIRGDVLSIVTSTGRLPKLCYLVNPVDMADMVKRTGARVDDLDRLGESFELNTGAGIVKVVGDRWHPRGCTHKFVICACGGATAYLPNLPGVDKCIPCRQLSRAQPAAAAPARPASIVRIFAPPDDRPNDCPSATGPYEGICRTGVGRYKLRLPVKPNLVQVDYKAAQLLYVFTAPYFGDGDGVALEVWTWKNEPHDLAAGEEIVVTYAGDQPLATTPVEIKPGDAVRWWPDGHDQAGRAIVDRYIDGVQLDRGRTYIRVTGSHGFTEWVAGGGWRLPAVGGVVDTSISPGTIQRLNPAPRPYAPGKKMTDRHPDSVIAKVAEETIEETWRRFDQDFPPGEPKLGDLVRWWPLVTMLGTPAAHAEWIDGLVTAKYRDGHFDIRITARSSSSDEGPEIQTAPGTLVRCHRTDRALYVDTPSGPIKVTSDTTVRPDEIRLRSDPDGSLYVETKHGPVKIAGVPTFTPDHVRIHIEPDPLDLAQQQAARVAEHQRKGALMLQTLANAGAVAELARKEVERVQAERMQHLASPFHGVDRSATPEKLSGAMFKAPPPVPAERPDPLDVEYDGVKLRNLLSGDESRRRHEGYCAVSGRFTPAQRAAVSAHWSAELRAKVAAGRAAALQSERQRITCDPRDPIDMED